jgi:NitT/TauT family transport system substrate-binding protein
MAMSLLRTAAFVLSMVAGSMGAPSGTFAQTVTPVTFSLDFRPLGRHAAWYVALDKGHYKQAGLEVTIIPGQGTAQAIQALESGVVQFAFSDVAGVVAARANSAATAKMVAVIYQKAPYAIFSLKDGANLTKPEQLEGLEIGTGAGSFTQKVIEAFMAQRGLQRPASFTNIDPAARVAMLASKKIPAVETFIMSQPGVIKAVGADQARTFLLADHGLQLYSNGILVREDLLKEKPDLVKGFVKASLQGWKDTIADPKAAADIVMKYNKGLDREVVLDEIAIVTELVATGQTKTQGLGTINEGQMQESVALILKTIGGNATVPARDIYNAAHLPNPPVLP